VIPCAAWDIVIILAHRGGRLANFGGVDLVQANDRFSRNSNRCPTLVLNTGSRAAGDNRCIAAIVRSQLVAGDLRSGSGGKTAPHPSRPEDRISVYCGACGRNGGSNCSDFGKLYGSATLSQAESLASYRGPDWAASVNPMKPRVAIPLPHGSDPEYAQRAIPQYERAIRLSGAEPVRIPLDQTPAEVMKLIERCDAVLLPGSKADVDPAKFDAETDPKSAAADPKRDTVDELLLQDAYNMRKPVLGICYGLQILNVYRSGTLVQHIESPVNHEAGKQVVVAHEVEIDEGSKLAEIVRTTHNVPGKAGKGTASSRAEHLPESLDGTTVSRAIPVNSESPVNHEAGKQVAVAHEIEIDEGSKLVEIVRTSHNVPGEIGKGPASSRAEHLPKSPAGTTVSRAVPIPVNSESPVNHEAGKQVAVAHEVEIDEGSKLAEIVRTSHNVSGKAGKGTPSSRAEHLPESLDGTTVSRAIPVNSSHHQSADRIGDGLKIVARSPQDGIVEALEGTSPDHFVLAVQWHPERSFDDDANSKAIFRALVEAAKQKHQELAGEFEGQSNGAEGSVPHRSGQVRATQSNR
jgi:gamma-glutamyl-gamma-aminobutyrate hydrolase PuuD